jgi:hypothetical protein
VKTMVTFIRRIVAFGHAVPLAMIFIALGSARGDDPLLSPSDRPGHAVPAPATPDPLAGTPAIAPGATGYHGKADLARMLPSRTDSPSDWNAGLECLHECGEPRLLPPCVPPPPCHPSCPPQPLDLVGVSGMPTNGPRYRGPCCPRTGTHDNGPFSHVHRLHDRAFDRFYRTK